MVHRRRWILLLVAVLIAAPSQAQVSELPPRNSMFVEMLGNGGAYSVNFDRKLSEHLSLRVGLAHWTAQDLSGDAEMNARRTTVPLLANYLLGSGNGRFEVGAGVLGGFENGRRFMDEPRTTSTFVSVTGVIGYRFQPGRRGWMYRAGFTPFFGFGTEDDAYPDKGLLPSVGASVGRTF